MATNDEIRDEARKLSDQRIFTLLIDRFDIIEEQNREQLQLLAKHIDEDAKIHAIVNTHQTYFSMMKWAFGAFLPGGAIYIAWTQFKP
jgi:hypothetical protein